MSKIDINETGMAAVAHIQQHEKIKLNWSCIDWNEFFHMLIIWLVGAIVIGIVLFAITMFDDTTNIVHDVVNRLDTLSLMFSLIFSATLEQIWNNRQEIKYKLTQISEILLSLLGLIIYLTFSIMEKNAPDNTFYINRYQFHVVYIIAVVVVVVLGFLARAHKEKG